jgi:uncharacterized protein YggT (Ycf19 family)
VRIQNITVDCDDPYRLVAFWAKVTDFQEDPENRNEPDDPEGLLIGPGEGPNMLFIKAPESTGGTSRLRLDLTPTDRSRDEEVDRLLKMGATLVADHRSADGDGWVLLADPAGNEFTVARRAAEATEAPMVPATPPAPSATTRAKGRPSWLSLAAARRGDGGRSPSPLGRLWSREVRARVGQLVRLALLLLEALIALRVILKVAGANEHAGFVSFLNRITSPLVGPFHPVFADGSVNGHPFEVGSLLAMAVYAAAAYIVVRLMRLFFSPRG